MIRAIGNKIVELSVVALTSFFIWGIGFLIVKEINAADAKYEQCVASQMQWVGGNCVR